MDWTRICSLQEIPVLGARPVRRAKGLDVAVFRSSDDKVFALLDRCPHQGGPLSMGLIFGMNVACPLHNWTISLVNGRARAPHDGCTPTFQVKLDGDEVYLLQTELDTLALDTPAAPHRIPIAIA